MSGILQFIVDGVGNVLTGWALDVGKRRAQDKSHELLTADEFELVTVYPDEEGGSEQRPAARASNSATD